MKDTRVVTKRLCRIFFCGALVVTAFIFYQSCKSMDESGATSSALMALLKPIFDPNNQIPAEVFHHYLRKTAHFVEFCALGVCWGVYVWQRGVLKGRRYAAMPMLLTLATAVADEYLQYFTHRGSAVTDVVLDYSGALTGLAVVCLIGLCVRWIQKKSLRSCGVKDKAAV